MPTRPAGATELDPQVEAYIRGLIESAARQRLPELFTGAHPDALYRVEDRNGVSTVVLRMTSLTEEQLIQLMKYRLAQYLAVNFVDPRMVYEARIEHEPLSRVTRDDIHIIAGSTATGEILCYATIEAGPDMPEGATLRDTERPFFPVEKIHGWGIYNRLRVLPDLPVAKLREVGRFVKNQRLHTFDELGARAPIEVGVALFRALAGPLRLEVEAIIGDLEEGVAKQNLDFFHVPMVVIHGTVPYEAEASYFFPRYQYCTVYPFAALGSDISREMLARLDAIEKALALPGKQGLLALLQLKRDIRTPRSTLEPPEGLAPLTAADLPQREVAMRERRQMLDMAERLRAVDLFSGLSVAEATVLGTFMARREIPVGEAVVRQGEAGDALYVIESGRAEVRAHGPAGETTTVATLGPGDYFGEIALVTGEERTADVVAITPLTVMRLSKDDYEHYLSHAAEVEQQVTRAALSRTRETARKLSAPAAAAAPGHGLFGEVSALQASVLGTFMQRREVGAGETIVRQGEVGDSLYLIQSGEAEVRVSGPGGEPLTVATLGPGEYFGEIALVTGEKRIADVVSTTPMTLVRLDKEGYDRYLAHAAGMQQQMARTAASRATETAAAIKAAVEAATAERMRQLAGDRAAQLIEHMERREVEAGAVVLRQGEPGGALFLIESGRAEVRVRDRAGRSVRVAALGPDEFFGEVALATGGPNIADVVALTPLTLLRLDREGYDRYLASIPEVAQALAFTAAVRACAAVRRLTGEAE